MIQKAQKSEKNLFIVTDVLNAIPDNSPLSAAI